MASGHTLGKDERLKSRKGIERVFREGKSFALFPFRIYFAPLQLPPGRTPPRLQAGFGASSRNFKKAVDRNRIKRLSREAYRLQKQPLYDWLKEKDRTLAVFFIYTGKELPEYGVVRDKIGQALQKLMKEPGPAKGPAPIKQPGS
ncbi:MAG TPA: ribonuclease P protein component [Puia sp.]|jgi:ribonuclease P protein component|nr:ribonuclease P protein component [Puia sp.]